MANFSTLKAAINAVIKTNGQKEITGEVLNQVLNAMVTSLGANYQFAGVATPSTNPGTPDQNVFYMAIEAGTYTNFNATVLPAGISILLWNGSWSHETFFEIDSVPTSGSDNLVSSGAVFEKMKLDGGAYDVSAHNGGATFASLSSLLSSENLNTLIPVDVRHGGMSIRFVHSSDNKYVQYRYMETDATTTATFTNIANWQGIDVTPTKNSKNIPESDGVYELLAKNKNVVFPSYTVGAILYNGTIQISSTNYGYSAPIQLRPKETILLNKGEAMIRGQYVSVIYECDEYGTWQRSLLTGNGSSQITTYTNNGDANIYIGICCQKQNLCYYIESITQAAPNSDINNLNEKINDVALKGSYDFSPTNAIRASISGDTGNITADNTRILFSLPINSNIQKVINITIGSGYKYVYREFSEDYSLYGIGDTLDLTKVVHGDASWRTTTQSFNIKDTCKSIVFLFARTDDSTIYLDELLKTAIAIKLYNSLDFLSTQVPYLDMISKAKNSLQIYNPNNHNLVVEESNVSSGAIYINDTMWAVRGLIDKTFNTNNDFASELGVSTVTSPSGATNCISIASGSVLCFKVEEKVFAIKTRATITSNDLPVIACVDGRIVRLAQGTDTMVFIPQLSKINLQLYTNKYGLYKKTTEYVVKDAIKATVSGQNGLIDTSNNRIFFHIPSDCYAVKITLGSGYKFVYREFSEDFIGYGINDYLDLTKVVQGSPAWISQSKTYIVKDTCKSINMLFAKSNDANIQLSELVSSNIKIEIISDIQNLYELCDARTKIDIFTSDKSKNFLNLFNGASGNVEPFLFFSDPHFYTSYNENVIKDNATTYIKTFKDYFDNLPLNFVLSGGDWLTAHKQSVAVQDLGEIDGYMNKLFNMLYYPMNGNHDNNYQGELDETDDTTANDGAISDQALVNLWFRKWNKMYYSFNGSSSKFYIFDSGVDNDATMTTYRWQQVDWFANELLTNQDEHIIMGIHIISIYGDNFGNIAPLANNLTKVAQAFNARSSVTLNGITYDFTNGSGTVHCILCGHTHYDYTGTLNDIPVFCVRDAQSGSFDLVLLDYGAGKLKSIRVGSGSDREINLVN